MACDHNPRFPSVLAHQTARMPQTPQTPIMFEGVADLPSPPAAALSPPQFAGVARSLFGTPSRQEIEDYFQKAEAALRRDGGR